ncbi:MAG: DUF2953 domain-containing protein [Clostridioides sp.]|jgi:hypothetical protein|nr:DUF2953 domain-containing protein [Clostridioides sp.]
MKLFGIFSITSVILVLLCTLGIVFLILRSAVDIYIDGSIDEDDKRLDVKVGLLHNLIKVKRQLYPPKNEENKDGEKDKFDRSILVVEDVLTAFELLEEVDIKEIYSDIEFGSTNMYLTSGVFLLANTVYASFAGILDPENFYLKITPDYTRDYIIGKARIHFRITVGYLVYLLRVIHKIYSKNKGKNRDGDSCESDGFNKESYGNNP